MGRFFAFLFVFVLGGVVGVALGGFGGAAAGGYLGACKVVDQGVSNGSLTQDEANAIIKSIAADLQIKPDQKTQLVEQLKKSGQTSPCTTAIEAL